MVNSELINAGDFDAICDLTRQAVEQMLGFRFVHIGINQPDESTSKKTSDNIYELFGFSLRETGASFFAGEGLEVMKSMGEGSNGHIAVRTNYLFRAFAYLSRKGVKFRMDTARYDEKGRMKFIYLEDEIGGFAVHLVQK